MVILVSPDSHGRIDLSEVVQDRQYAVSVASNGVITLTPSAIPAQRTSGDPMSVFPVISPEDAFGVTGVQAAAEAVYVNKEHRRRGNLGKRVSAESELHELIWGDVA